MIPATITFKLGTPPQKFNLHFSGEGSPWIWPDPDNPIFHGQTWRFLADDSAIEIVPLCNTEARLVKSVPLFDWLEIRPVRWGYPESLITDHPAEVEQMRQDHHAGKHDLIDGNYTWPYWLEHHGQRELWARFRTKQIARHWLNWSTPPGSKLAAFAGRTGKVRREVLERIQFCADFYNRDQVATIWLADCSKSLMSAEEMKCLPGRTKPQNAMVELPKTFSAEQVCKELGCKRATLKNYCRTLNISGAAITPAQLAAIRDYRASRTRRPHLKTENRARR